MRLTSCPLTSTRPSLAYLDGGCEGGGDVDAEAGWHGELGHVLFLPDGAGDAMLAQQLQAGHPVLHTHYVQRRSARKEEARVPVAPAQRGDGTLRINTHTHTPF